MAKKVLILGAGGRDFHNFNMVFRDNPEYQVVGFTATQIPNIDKRAYPPSLAGKLYPKGIPIYPENQAMELIKKEKIEVAVLAYSDLSHSYVMHKASEVIAAGADFWLLGGESTFLKSRKKVIAVTAVRTGCGKGQVSRTIVSWLRKKGIKAVAIRHPMPYGNLEKQTVQRFEKYEDLDKHECTVEEREEYEPFIENGLVLFAGVDYGKILAEAEKEADVILWDGGNNDLPFIKPDIHIVIADPHRAGDEINYYPGESNLRMAGIVIINKVNTAKEEDVEKVKKNIHEYNPRAAVLEADSVITVAKPEDLKGKKVLVIEDGPTTTHGGMGYGAGYLAAKQFGAEIVDPRKYAIGSIKEAFQKFTQLKDILPALGYGEKQLKELEQTINSTPCDLVLVGTPINLGKLIKVNKPCVRVYYNMGEKAAQQLTKLLEKLL
ncbi:MAG: GTPase [Candidatus Aenigmarchaeota archaeon]|nr:GTPase [Candidatus Aenigmarchaeota archaeon]